MSKTSKNLISIGFVLLILVVVYTCVFVFDLKPRLGLDLKGGISIVYEAKGAKVDQGVLDKTVEKIRERIDKLGVAEPEVTRQGSRNVAVQLPGIHDPERAKQIIGKTAQLQFRLVTDSKAASEVKDDPNWKVTEGEQNLQPTKEIILPLKEGKSKMLLKLGPTLMTGDKLQKAQSVIGETGSSQINFTLTGDGKKTFADITTANVNKQLAIVLDYVVESAPTIQTAITDGRGEITGKFTSKEAKDLEIVLNTGALPVELKPINEQDVTATLGRDSLRKGLIAGIVGIAAVALFMLLYYRALGVITCLGLIVFGGLMYGFICVLGEFWSLTLAGIAGVIVSIGIAGDSSIVYFERLKEDIREGRTMRSSAERAYKSAFRTIIAADTVSFAAAAILYIFAVGSVKGFAFTLGMATIFDVFISYFFTRPMTALLSGWRVFGKPAAIGVRSVAESGAGGETG
ncbi:MAG: protein translocase subunit SecD [Actinobacteria bacterium]|nr:protein translocase subunit SecD [Actinomycetota bacterium]